MELNGLYLPWRQEFYRTGKQLTAKTTLIWYKSGCPQVLRFLQLQEASCPYFLCLLFAFFMEFKILLAIMSCHKCCIVSKRGVSGLWLLDRYGIVVATYFFCLIRMRPKLDFYEWA